MTPQQKKSLSLKKDRRNTCGRNDKASRKNVPWRKHWVNRSFRRLSGQVIRHGAMDTEELGDAVGAVPRKTWKKRPDRPLGELLHQDLLNGIEAALCSESQKDPAFFPWLEQSLLDRGVPKAEVRVVMRRAKHVMTPQPLQLEVPHPIALLLKEILAGRKRPNTGTKTDGTRPGALSAHSAPLVFLGFSDEWRRRSRKWHKEFARSYAESVEDEQRVEAVVDALCNVLEGLKSIEAVREVFVEAFTKGGLGTWRYAGTLLVKLSASHPAAAELWGEFCRHPSAEVRLRAVDFLPGFPRDVRARWLEALQNDPDLSVRMQASSGRIRSASAKVQQMFYQLLAAERRSREK
jgi:hypothetical protein